MADLSVTLGKLKLKNPVLVASGTFGYGQDYEDLMPAQFLGALVTKTITLHAREGNPCPRIAETHQGMLNSIGLENQGVIHFLRDELPRMRKLSVPIIVSISAESPSQFTQLVKSFKGVSDVAAFELNVSCPNLGKKELIGQNAKAVYQVTKAVKRATKLPVIVKLTPNVTNIADIARSAKRAGADTLSLVNTFSGMAVDIATKAPKLGRVSGGLSGPAIKPLALSMVYQVYKAVKIPIIGMGGITSAEDALEFMICGATAVAVGTASFVNPKAALEVIQGIASYLDEHELNNVSKLIGSIKDGK